MEPITITVGVKTVTLGKCFCGQRIYKVEGGKCEGKEGVIRYRYPGDSQNTLVTQCKKCSKPIPANWMAETQN